MLGICLLNKYDVFSLKLIMTIIKSSWWFSNSSCKFNNEFLCIFCGWLSLKMVLREILVKWNYLNQLAVFTRLHFGLSALYVEQSEVLKDYSYKINFISHPCLFKAGSFLFDVLSIWQDAPTWRICFLAVVE